MESGILFDFLHFKCHFNPIQNPRFGLKNFFDSNCKLFSLRSGIVIAAASDATCYFMFLGED